MNSYNFILNKIFNSTGKVGFKKIFLLCILLNISFIVLSCNESVSPKADFKEKYVLYSIINADSSLQTVFISRSYDVEGFNPLENKIDPAMEGAVVSYVVNGSKTYSLREGQMPRTDTSRYKTPIKYYYTNEYLPKSLDKVDVYARLTNGVELRGTTQVPPVSYLSFNMIFIFDPTSDTQGNHKLIFSWSFPGTSIKPEDNFFFPRVDIVYAKADAPDDLIRVKLPLYFIEKKESWMPIYPGAISGNIVHYYRDAVVRVLNLISEGDPNKGNYIFHECQLALLLMDRNLAMYISAETTFKEEFSVRIDPLDFTNIQSGLGLFGAYGRRETKFRISPFYLKSIGYKTTY